jgi:hypothetical protein
MQARGRLATGSERLEPATRRLKSQIRFQATFTFMRVLASQSG